MNLRSIPKISWTNPEIEEAAQVLFCGVLKRKMLFLERTK